MCVSGKAAVTVVFTNGYLGMLRNDLENGVCFVKSVTAQAEPAYTGIYGLGKPGDGFEVSGNYRGSAASRDN